MPKPPLSNYAAAHFRWRVADRVGFVELDRPERKNPLTFDSYAELRDLFRALPYEREVRAIVFSGAGGNFCSGGDVHEIIGPLTRMAMPELLDFTRMTGDLVRAIRACPQVVIAAVDGVCAGAGAILAMASDIRLGTAAARTAFLFTRVGLAGCDMGACAILPRLIGQGRAAELLITGRAMTAEEGLAWGFFSRLVGAGSAARGGAGAGAAVRKRPRICARDDQEHAESGVEHEHRASTRGGGSGPSDLHEDGGFQARFRCLCRAHSAAVRGPMSAGARYHEELLGLPFFEATHRAIAAQANAWAAAAALDAGAHAEERDAVDARCRDLAARLGAAGLTRYCVPERYGGALPDFDARSICLIRETLAYYDGLADFAFAMQGLGSGAISLAGSASLQAHYLPKVARGEAIAGFALSEPEAGSDVAAMTCRAERQGGHYVLDGAKTWISNGGIADFYCVFARTGAGPGASRRNHGCAGHQRVRRAGRRSGTVHRAAHRGQRAASARAARFPALSNSGGAAHWSRGRGVQDRHAHARCVPRLGGGGGDRVRAARLG